MRTHDIHRYNMFVRVKEFGAAHRDLFPAAGTAPPAVRRDFDGGGPAERLRHHGSLGTGRSARRRDVQSRRPRRVQAGARRHREDGARPLDTPGLGDKFYLPSVRNDHELATAARGFARTRRRSRRSSSRTDCRSRSSPTCRPRSTRSSVPRRIVWRRARRAPPRRRASARPSTGARLAFTRLDAIVANTLRDEPTLLAAWNVRDGREVEAVPAVAGKATPGSGVIDSADAGGQPC